MVVIWLYALDCREIYYEHILTGEVNATNRHTAHLHTGQVTSGDCASRLRDMGVMCLLTLSIRPS